MWKEKEFLELLTNEGIDTCCFMGSGYNFNNYRVGQEFYFTYAYYGVLAKIDNQRTFDDIKSSIRSQGVCITDRFKLIRKYIYELNKIYGFIQRNEKILIKNLRTKEIMDITNKEDVITRFYYCVMCEPI